jgi:hypothetical protein
MELVVERFGAQDVCGGRSIFFLVSISMVFVALFNGRASLMIFVFEEEGTGVGPVAGLGFGQEGFLCLLDWMILAGHRLLESDVSGTDVGMAVLLARVLQDGRGILLTVQRLWT